MVKKLDFCHSATARALRVVLVGPKTPKTIKLTSWNSPLWAGLRKWPLDQVDTSLPQTCGHPFTAPSSSTARTDSRNGYTHAHTRTRTHTHTHSLSLHHLPLGITIQDVQWDHLLQPKRTKMVTILRLTSLKWGFQSRAVHRGSAPYPEVKAGRCLGSQTLRCVPWESVAWISHLLNHEVPPSHHTQCNENLQGFHFIYITVYVCECVCVYIYMCIYIYI